MCANVFFIQFSVVRIHAVPGSSFDHLQYAKSIPPFLHTTSDQILESEKAGQQGSSFPPSTAVRRRELMACRYSIRPGKIDLDQCLFNLCAGWGGSFLDQITGYCQIIDRSDKARNTVNQHYYCYNTTNVMCVNIFPSFRAVLIGWA